MNFPGDAQHSRRVSGIPSDTSRGHRPFKNAANDHARIAFDRNMTACAVRQGVDFRAVKEFVMYVQGFHTILCRSCTFVCQDPNGEEVYHHAPSWLNLPCAIAQPSCSPCLGSHLPLATCSFMSRP